jgi:transcriptional regulator with XRE-family HTH domain
MYSNAQIAALGARIRARRQQLGLSQSLLAAMTKLSRASVNALESGTTDLGVAKVFRIAQVLDMDLQLQQKATGPGSWLDTAAAAASVSYNKPLPAPVLALALKTGEVPPEYRPHFATLLEEASPALLVRALSEVFPDGIPKGAWKHLARIGKETRIARDFL